MCGFRLSSGSCALDSEQLLKTVKERPCTISDSWPYGAVASDNLDVSLRSITLQAIPRTRYFPIWGSINL